MSCSRERISWFYDYFHLGLVLIVLDFFYKFLLFYWHLVKLTKGRQLEKNSPQFSSTCSMLMNVCSYQGHRIMVLFGMLALVVGS